MSTKPLTSGIAAALLTASLVTTARADITTGLVGYWNLSDGPGSSTVADSTTNGNTGTLMNFSDSTYNNMWTTSSDPNNGWPYAMLFNQASEGTDTYINVPDSTSLNLPTSTKQWTLSAWVKCSVAGTAEPQYAGIIAKGNQSREAYALYMNDTTASGKFSTAFRNSAGTGGTLATSATVAAAGTWYHVVGTVLVPKQTGSWGEPILWVNGVVQSGTNSNTYTTVYSSSGPVTIGCRANSSGTVNAAFAGTIDEVRLYSRALTTNDVIQLYNNKAFILNNNGVGMWNGLAGSGGNATLDTTSLNFNTNLYTAPLGAGTLPNVLSVEQASALSLGCGFADKYYSSGATLPVTATNITIATGGVAIGSASGPGTNTFLNSSLTYTLTSPDGIGLKDGANPTALVQSGNGTVILLGNNSFSGGVTINSGTIQLGNGTAAITGSELGTASLVINNGALVLNGNNSLNLTNQTVTGIGSLTWKNPGTLTLNSANNYSGGTIFGNNTIQTASLSDTASPVGTGSITMNGGASLLYTGTAENSARQLSAAGGTTNTLDVASGNTLELSGQVLRGSGSGAAQLIKSSAGSLTLSGSADNANLNLNITDGTVILSKSSTASVHALGGGSSYVGNGATLQLSGSGGVEMSTTVALTVNSGGVLDLNAQNNTIASLNISGTGIGGTGALINSFPSTPPTLTCPIVLAADSTLGGAGSLTLPGVISGSGALTYTGSGILTLQGTNTYTGTTTVSAGILDANVPSSLPGNVILNGGTLQLDSNFAMSSIATLALPVSPAANSVNLNFSGTQTIAVLTIGGVAQPAGTYGPVGSSAANPNAAFTTGAPGIINVTGTANWDPGLSNAAPGSGGNGSWDAATHDWFTGSADAAWPLDAVAFFAGSPGNVTLNANVAADELTFVTAGYTLTNTDGTSALTLDGNNPTIAIPAGNTTIACTLAESGASPVLINGSGTLFLTGTNTYAGGTTINGATVKASTITDANGSLGPSGTVTMLGGSTLSYTGAGPGSTVRGVTSTGGATSIIDVPAGNLTLAGPVRNSAGGNPSFTKTGAGTLILGGTNDNPSMNMAVAQGLVQITKSSAASVHGLGGSGAPGLSTVAGGAELQLAGSGGADIFSGVQLTVASGGLFDAGGQSDTFNTLTLSGTGFGGGALINSVAATTSFLTNNGSGVVLAAATTMGGPGNIALAGVVSGSSALTYAGTGTLTFYASSANTYSGGTIVNSGGAVTFIGNANAAGTGAITDTGTLNIGISGNNAMFPNAISGAGIVNIVETSGNNLQQSGSMASFTGTLNCPASASTAKFQILTTGVSINSAATVNIAAGGTLYIGGAGVVIPCPVNIYGLGNTETYGALRVENGALVSGPVTLFGDTTIGGAANTGTGTISGAIGDGGNHYAVTKTSPAGTTQLTGVNTYSGVTTINGGTLTIGGAGQLGGGNYTTNLTINTIFNYASSAPQTLSGVVGGVVSGNTNLLVQSGPGVLTLTATNTFSGGIAISNGASLTLSGGGCLGVTGAATNFAGTISNSGVFLDASASAQTLSGAISGPGALVQTGSGTLTLNAGNNYTGITVISNNATLALTSLGTINTTASVSIDAGSSFDVSAYTTYTLLGSITLKASGTGIVPGSTAATIKGAASAGATVTLASPLGLTYRPQTFTGDASHPALYVSQISSGILNVSASSITVNNAGASPLGVGTYSLVQVPAGGSINLGSPALAFSGNGLANGTGAALAVSGTSLNLVVTNSATYHPAISSIAVAGANIVFSGTNGAPNGPYYVLTSTNVALPLSQWTSIATDSFSGTGTFSVTNAIGTDPSRFFRIQSQ